MKPEKITILNNKKEKLVGRFYKNTSEKILIMCHGAETINGYLGIEDAFLFYYQSGISLFSFDFSGHGESDGSKGLSIRRRVDDIGSVIAYFAKEYKEVILYGHSFGAMSVAIAARKYKNINKLICVNGFFNFNPRQLYFKQALFIGLYILIHPSVWPEIMYWLYYSQPQKIMVPTLVVYGGKDKEVKILQSRSFFEKLSVKKQLIIVPEGDHALMDKNLWPQLYPILEWIKK